MNRTRSATFIVFLAALSTATATLVSRFTSWDDLTQKSPDIIIARCTAVPDTRLNVDDMVWADIEVLSVLKGDTWPGTARMVSQYRPYPGERFLMFATYQNDKRYPAYNATEAYRVVPFESYLLTIALTGRPLTEQIQLVLRQRLEDLNHGWKPADDEKKRLKEGLKK
jgi:hypothetical protein